MGGPTSRGWIRTFLPRKGTPEDCEYRFPQRRQQFALSLHQIVELRMCALSHRIREKPSWWEKVKDRAVVEEWREEALQEEEEDDEAPSWNLTPAMVNLATFEPVSRVTLTLVKINYVLEELHGYASLRDPKAGLEVWSALVDILHRD